MGIKLKYILVMTPFGGLFVGLMLLFAILELPIIGTIISFTVTIILCNYVMSIVFDDYIKRYWKIKEEENNG